MQKINEDSSHVSPIQQNTQVPSHKRKRGNDIEAPSPPDRQRIQLHQPPETIEHELCADNGPAIFPEPSQDPYEYPANSWHSLETFFKKSESSPSDTSRNYYQSLLQVEQNVPVESRFDDEKFATTVTRFEGHHEARIVKDIGGYLVVASAEDLTAAGHTDLKTLVETVEEPWSSCFQILDIVPKPHYAVGFHCKAFSDDQQRVLDREEQRCKFRVSPSLIFPFLACQVTTMRGELGALRRNTHSAGVAMHGVVQLFRRAKRERELHREVLFFSITYDCHKVAIHGHFVEIDGHETKYGSVLIKHNDFCSEPENKWLSYKFTTSLYKIWAQMHLKRICSVIEDLLAACQRELPPTPTALSPVTGPKAEYPHPITTVVSQEIARPVNAVPTIERELAPDPMLIGEEIPQHSTPARINEDHQSTVATASSQNYEDALPENATHDDFVRSWCRTYHWPSRYFESGGTTMKDILHSFWRSDSSDSDRQIRTHPRITRDWSLSLPELERETSELSDYSGELRSTGSSDARRHLLNCEEGIEFLKNHSCNAPEGLSSSAEDVYQRLIQTEQSVPYSNSDGIFARIAKRTRETNKAKIAMDIGAIVAPRVDTLYINGDDSLKYLAESLDETWSICASIHKSYPPKPYYAAGFHRTSAFTDGQRSILRELDPDYWKLDGERHLFRVTGDVFFPFLVIEPTEGCFQQAKQWNTANALIAMRGVIELFRAARRLHEINRDILAFSVVYDACQVRICAHFADVLDASQRPRFYRHNIFTSSFPKDGWASYKFIMNIYKVFAPMHHARICSAIASLTRGPESACLSSAPAGEEEGSRSHSLSEQPSPRRADVASKEEDAS